MCGRFILDSPWDTVSKFLKFNRPEDRGRNVGPRYNIAPTQDVFFVHEGRGERLLNEGRWWLVPHWAKEVSNKYPTFNARSEGIETKASFRDAFKTKRCLVPASAYWEWVKVNKTEKDPYCLHLPEFEPFAFAGLWAHNEALGVTSCTIITAPADPAIESIHSRMPVLLEEGSHEAWLDPDTTPDQAHELLKSHRGAELKFYRANRTVNSSKVEGPELIRSAS
jgi:putative SOS response-associated peptidase YedK